MLARYLVIKHKAFEVLVSFESLAQTSHECQLLDTLTALLW